MLREALRRFLWLGPTLLVVTAPVFWAVTMAADRVAGVPASPLPLFFNPSPDGAKEYAAGASAAIAAGGARAPAGAVELVHLGGAALPHVLPQLDSLSPTARGRVALALGPLAERMGLAEGELRDAEGAVLFWNRFWEEHQIDFTKAVVRRVVRRYVERPSSLRETEVRRLDTFALEELIDALRPMRSAGDVERASNAAFLASQITGEPLRIDRAASLPTARAIVEQWEAYWIRERSRYVASTGAFRLGATLLETRYGHWVESIARHGLGRDATGARISASFRERAPTTLLLLLAGAGLGHPLALVLAAAARSRRRDPLDWAAALASVAALCLTAVGLSRAAASVQGPGSGGAYMTMVMVGFAIALRHARALHRAAAERPFVRTALAFGASPFGASIGAVRLAAPAAVALGVANLPSLCTAAFVVERAFALRGLGDATVEAVRAGNATWLMAFALLGTLGLGLLQIGADIVHVALDPRLRPTTERTRRAVQ